MSIIGPSTGVYDPTHPAMKYTDHSGVTVSTDRARFLRPMVFNDAYEHCAPGSRVAFRSDAASLTASLFFNNLNTTPTYNDVINVYVDGVFFQEIDPTNNRTAHAYPVALNFGSRKFRTIEIIMPYCAGLDFVGIVQDPICLLLPCLPRTSVRMMCIGDSITHGFNASGSRQSWPFLLGIAKNWELVNMGYGSSRTVHHMEGDNVAAIHPDVIISMIGYNDFGSQTPLATFKSQYETMLNNLLAGSLAKIYAVTPLWGSATNTITLGQYRTAIGEVVTSIGNPRITKIDGLPLATNSTAHFPDGIHPNDAGSSAIASNLAPLVTL